MELKILKNQAKKEIDLAKNLKELQEIFKKYLGKKGKITFVLRSIKNLPEEQRKEKGKSANQMKQEVGDCLKEKMSNLKKQSEIQKPGEIDISAPGKKIAVGHLHPLTLTIRKVMDIFQNMGFSVIEGPEAETEWYNFDALNIPKDHPSRDLWDTFYLKNGFLLRTHTSPVQIRYMEKNQPPLRIIVPGRIFRHEATDASHEINFYQIEGLMIDKKGKVTVANFKAIIEEFFKGFFKKETKIRLRPSYFPFTEPSFEIDINCVNCQGKGCSVCAQTGWLEILGAGMVHPNVLKATGLNPKFWQGFAFGVGMDRLAMLKYKINDIRLFYSGDLRFLEQF